MRTEKDNNNGKEAECSYGGSKYRLTYDHAEGKNRRNKTKIRLRTVVIIFAMIVLFLVFTYFALKHYKDTVKELYDSGDTDTDEATDADYQSSVNIVVN